MADRGGPVWVLAKGLPPTPGGVERYSQEVTEAYSSHAQKVKLFAPVSGSSAIKRPYAVVPLLGTNQLLVAFQLAIRLVEHLWKCRGTAEFPEIIHATTWRMAVVPVLLRLNRRSKLVVTVHGREVLQIPPWLVNLRNRVLKSASLLIAVSPSTAEFLKKETGLESTVALNGTSVPDEHLLPKHCHSERLGAVLLTACRLEQRKNVESVVRSLLHLGDDVSLRVVGTGPEQGRLEQLAREIGVANRVHFCGRVSDEELWREYSDADIFVHPHVNLNDSKDIEGFGLTIADGMAMSLPVVVGDAAGIGDLLSENEGAILVDGNDLTAVVDAITRLVDDPASRRVFGERAKRYAGLTFSWQHHTDTILQTAGTL